MEIQITNEKTIKEIQTEFSNKYPFLKIEFYSKAHENMEGSPKEYTIHSSKKIGEIRSLHKTGELHIHGNMNVSSLEKEFKENFGLNVQVFRKSGKVWLQTTSTDEWSLSEQNHSGEEMAGNL